MAKITIFNIGKANALIDASTSVLAPALAKAGISTIAVDGKTVPVADAPLNLQISALLAAQPAVEGSQSAAQALESNELISAELDKTKTELAIKTTAVESLTRSNADLQAKLTTANATVQDLTVKNGVLDTQRNAAVSQFNTNADQLKNQKMALVQKCLAANCLDLTGDDGKPLAKDASDETKVAAAMKLSHDDLFKAFNGAVNSAIAKTGVTFAQIPSGQPSSTDKKPEAKGRARFSASAKVQGRN